jgi:hypothetical protein
MEREELIKLIQDSTIDSSEVVECLGISKQRLSDMGRTNKLVPVKKGIYLRQDVEARMQEQNALRDKYYRPSHKGVYTKDDIRDPYTVDKPEENK